MTNAVPPGFSPIVRAQGPFNTLIGPIYERRDGERLVMGLRVEDRHCNSQGFAHGGLLATLSDLGLGYAMIGKVEAGAAERRPFVTVNLSIDYLGAAKVGEWIESDVEVQKIGRSIAFCTGFLVAGGRRVVRASGVFALAGKGA